MEFDRNIRGICVMAIGYAGIAYLIQLASPCDGFLLIALLTFVQVPVLVLALVVPLIWRHAQGRPIKRQTVILAAWAGVITAFEVALIVIAPDQGHGCFK